MVVNWNGRTNTLLGIDTSNFYALSVVHIAKRIGLQLRLFLKAKEEINLVFMGALPSQGTEVT